MEKSIIDIIFYLAAPAFVLAAVYFLIRQFLNREYRLRLIEVKRMMVKETLPLRLQAYERMILFLERISPNLLLMRFSDTSATVRELQLHLIETIRSEYEHNLTQQIYISPQTWNIIKNAKEEMVRLINTSADKINPMSSHIELGKAIFETMMRNEEFPTQRAIDLVKTEAGLLFG
ncbi:MAG TPA: hypothetical protein PK736_04735 [Bacteroidia bacterium]|nr:hypothetical protein [Bacteroidota bacterium]HRC32729.1 hypothetical protein [Bacteroidia bacterium]